MLSTFPIGPTCNPDLLAITNLSRPKKTTTKGPVVEAGSGGDKKEEVYLLMKNSILFVVTKVRKVSYILDRLA